MSDYFEQKAMKTLKRLQKMRSTATASVQMCLDTRSDCEPGSNAWEKANEAVVYWQSQANALDQAICIVIDPDQLTLWSPLYETIQSE